MSKRNRKTVGQKGRKMETQKHRNTDKRAEGQKYRNVERQRQKDTSKKTNAERQKDNFKCFNQSSWYVGQFLF